MLKSMEYLVCKECFYEKFYITNGEDRLWDVHWNGGVTLQQTTRSDKWHEDKNSGNILIPLDSKTGLKLQVQQVWSSPEVDKYRGTMFTGMRGCHFPFSLFNFAVGKEGTWRVYLSQRHLPGNPGQVTMVFISLPKFNFP